MPENDSHDHPDLMPEGFDDGSGATFHPDLPESPEEAPEDGAQVRSETSEGLPEGLGVVESEFIAYDPTTLREDRSPEAYYDDEGNRLPSFDDRAKDDFEGLLYIGALSKSFRWLGHRFVIRTLTVDESLAVTMLTREYDQSMGAALAYKTATAAVCLVTVDGKEPPIPYQSEDDVYAWAHQRFDYVRTKWFQPTVEACYAQYLGLEAKSTQVVMAMGKALDLVDSTTG